MVTEASEFECRADQDDRDGSDQDVEGKPAVGGNPSSERIYTAPEHRHDIAPEIDEDGEQRAHMGHDVGEHALIRPVEQSGRQDEMAGRGNRQELGDALDQSEDEDLFDGHMSISPGNCLPPALWGSICAVTARQWRRGISPLHYDDLRWNCVQDHDVVDS